MSKLVWDDSGKHLYETGVDRGVLYLLKSNKYQTGIAWNGLTAVNESPSGGEASAMYADNVKYLNILSTEELAGTIEAYDYPKAFANCLGKSALGAGISMAQQRKYHFGFCYRTKIGNDTKGDNHGYLLHLYFNCLAQASDAQYTTIDDSPEAITHSWDFSAITVAVDGYKPTASMTLNSIEMEKAGLSSVLTAIENTLYGTDDKDATFLSIDELLELYSKAMHLTDSSGNYILDSDDNYIDVDAIIA